jgi:LuxR family maltose regulon positive regulatory protein
MQGDLRQARRLSRQALAAFGPDEPFWRSQAAWILSVTYQDSIESQPEDDFSLEEAVKIGHDTGNLMVTVSATCEQAHNHRRRGRLHQAQALYEQGLALAVDKEGRPLPIAGEALMGLGQLALEWNELDSAENYLIKGIEKTRQWREIAAFPGYILLAQLRQIQGDTAAADAAMEEARQLALHFDATEYDDLIVAAYRARLWIVQGHLEPARQWANERRLLAEASRPAVPQLGEEYQEVFRSFEELMLARLWLVEGQAEAALSLTDKIAPQFEAWQRVRLLLETQLLRAQAFLIGDDLQAARNTLQQALILGQPGDHVRVFVDEGEPLARLLRKLKTKDEGQKVYIGRLLTAFINQSTSTDTRPSPLVTRPSQPLIEPLSERELEVLQLMSEGLSNREIAQRLVLSLPTVKWHSSNIYGKLGVKNRTTAVAKARDLDILHSS